MRQERGEADRLESEQLEFYERVRRNYLSRAGQMPERFSIVDASLDIESVWQQIELVLQRNLKT